MFARHAEMPMARAGGDDDRLRHDFFAVHDEREGTLGKIHGLNDTKAGSRAETLGLFLHPRHQFVAIHAVGKAGEIFHDARGGEQAAGLLAGEHERRKLRAGRVKRRRPARRAGTDDDDFFHRRRKVIVGTVGDKAVRRICDLCKTRPRTGARAARPRVFRGILKVATCGRAARAPFAEVSIYDL